MKEHILEKATELFTRRGIRSVTMDDVSKHLSISKKTLYLHFNDKDDLVETIVQAQIKISEVNCIEFQKKAENAVEEMILILEFMNIYFAQRNPTLYYDLQKYYPKAWTHFTHHKENFIRKSIEDNLKRGIKEKLFHSDLAVKIVSRLRMEHIECVFNHELFPVHQFNLQSVHEQSMKLYMYGITTLKGHQLINKYLSKLNKKKQKA